MFAWGYVFAIRKEAMSEWVSDIVCHNIEQGLILDEIWISFHFLLTDTTQK